MHLVGGFHSPYITKHVVFGRDRTSDRVNGGTARSSGYAAATSELVQQSELPGMSRRPTETAEARTTDSAPCTARSGWQTGTVIGLAVDVAAVRHRTVAGGIIGIVVLLVIIGLIVFLLISRSKEKARADSAERELASLKQAYPQLNQAYRQSLHAEPTEAAESPQVPSQRPPTPGPPTHPPSLPQYPGTPPPPPRPPVS
jgi:predicted lipid-binding transport protein (Tim44 family)